MRAVQVEMGSTEMVARTLRFGQDWLTDVGNSSSSIYTRKRASSDPTPCVVRVHSHVYLWNPGLSPTPPLHTHARTCTHTLAQTEEYSATQLDARHTWGALAAEVTFLCHETQALWRKGKSGGGTQPIAEQTQRTAVPSHFLREK